MASEREKIIAEEWAKFVVFGELIAARKVPVKAVRDFLARGFTAFEDKPLDTFSGQDWADSQAVNAPHLFPPREGQAPAAGQKPPSTTGHMVLTPEQEKLPPAERMTLAREKQAQLEAGRAAGGQR